MDDLIKKTRDDVVFRILATFDKPNEDEEDYAVFELFEAAFSFSSSMDQYAIWYNRYMRGYLIPELSEEHGLSEDIICEHLTKVNEKLERYYASVL